jgi:hypothetical protein
MSRNQKEYIKFLEEENKSLKLFLEEERVRFKSLINDPIEIEKIYMSNLGLSNFSNFQDNSIDFNKNKKSNDRESVKNTDGFIVGESGKAFTDGANKFQNEQSVLKRNISASKIIIYDRLDRLRENINEIKRKIENLKVLKARSDENNDCQEYNKISNLSKSSISSLKVSIMKPINACLNLIEILFRETKHIISINRII